MAGVKLLIRIEKFDAVDPSVFAHVHIEFVADRNGPYLGGFFSKARISYVLSWIIRQLHNSISLEKLGHNRNDQPSVPVPDGDYAYFFARIEFV